MKLDSKLQDALVTVENKLHQALLKHGVKSEREGTRTTTLHPVHIFKV